MDAQHYTGKGMYISRACNNRLRNTLLYTGGNVVLPVEQYDDSVMILRRNLLIEYLASPQNDHSRTAVEEFCTKADIPLHMYNRWKRQRSFQEDLARCAKDSIYTGEGAAQTYIQLQRLIDDPTLDAKERARLVLAISKLHLKHLEILSRMQLAASKQQHAASKASTLESLIEELRSRKILAEVTTDASDVGGKVQTETTQGDKCAKT